MPKLEDYDQLQIDLVMRLTSKGMSRRDVFSRDDVPSYPDFMALVRDDVSVRRRWLDAQADGAFVLEDKIEDIALGDDVMDRDTRETTKLRLDALKHLSAIRDPRRHLPKMQAAVVEVDEPTFQAFMVLPIKQLAQYQNDPPRSDDGPRQLAAGPDDSGA